MMCQNKVTRIRDTIQKSHIRIGAFSPAGFPRPGKKRRFGEFSKVLVKPRKVSFRAYRLGI